MAVLKTSSLQVKAMSGELARMLGGVLSLLLAGVLAMAAAPAGQAPQLTPAASDAAAAKFRRIEEAAVRRESFGSIRVTQTEINSYVHFGLEPVFPPGISKIMFDLQPGRTHGTAEVDFDKLKGSFKTPPNPLVALFLHGVHTIGGEGTLAAQNGLGEFHLETVTLDGITLPDAVVEYLIEHYLRAHFPDAALDRPFPLGFSIDKLIVESGSVLLVSRPAASK